MKTPATDGALLRRALILVVVFNLLFLALVVLTARCNRIAQDDFLQLAKLNELGLLGATRWHWDHWTGRWACILVVCATTGIVQQHGDLTAYTLLTIAAVIASLWHLSHALFRRLFCVRLPPLAGLNAGIFLTGVLFFATRDAGEVWYWLGGSATYLWPLAAFFTACALLLPEEAGAPAVGLASFLFALIPGFNDSLAILVIPVFAFLLFRAARPPLGGWKAVATRARAHRVFWPLLLCFFSWLLATCAPGNRVRIEVTGDLQFARFVPLTLLLTVRGGGYLLLIHGYWLLLSLITGFVIGNAFRGRGELRGAGQTIPILRAILLGVVYVTLLTLAPVALAYGHAADRIYIHMTVSLVGACAALGYCLSRSRVALALSPRVYQRLVIGSLLLACVLSGRHLSVSVPEARRYARSYDARLTLLQAKRASFRERELTLEPLAPSGPLYSAEVTRDGRHWVNVGIKEALSLPFDVRVPGAARR